MPVTHRRRELTFSQGADREAAVRPRPHLTPTPPPSPRKAKIFSPTFATTSPSQGSSCHAPGLSRQYASSAPSSISPPSGVPGTLHPAQLLLQVADLVAQSGGELELKLAGGGVHLVAQLLDQVGQVLGRHARELQVPLRPALARAHPRHGRLAPGLLPPAPA